MIGKTINHYLILDKVGEGGMGIVYRARDLNLEREVALKFLSLDFTGSQELKQRFILEAQSASVLDHPNICTIHAIEETEDGRLFIVMAYYAGQTIKAKLREGPLAWQEVTNLAVQIASGLGAAHERGLIHMDVKPANLLVTPDGTLKILDFGLSRFTSEVDRTRPRDPLMGTVAYMSPEQVQNEQTGPESDIWALGVVLYELITGERPFQGKNDMAVLYTIVHKDVEPPIKIQPDMPSELDKVIRRMLVKDRNYRYLATAEVLVDLEPLRQSSQTVTDPLPWVTRQDWQRQKLLQRLTVAAALLVIVFSVILALRLRDDDSPPVDSGARQALLIGFQDFSATDNAWLGRTLEEFVLSEIPPSSELQWIRNRDRGEPFENVLSETGYSPLTRNRIQQETNAEWIVGGRFQISEAEADRLYLNLVAQHAKNGELIGSEEIDAEIAELPEIVARWVSTLAPAMKISRVAPVPTRVVTGQLDSEAARLLLSAREKLRVLEAKEARELVDRGLKIAPDSPELQLVLVQCLWHLRHDKEALQVVSEAARIAANLPRQEQILIQAWQHQIRGNFPAAVALKRWLWFHGKSTPPEYDLVWLDQGLDLAGVLARTKQTPVALEVIESLAAHYPEDPRIYLARANTVRGDSRLRQHQEAARAVDVANQIEAPLVLARAFMLEGEAFRWQGKARQATDKLNAALEIYVQRGYKFNQAITLMELGNVQWNEGDLLGARGAYERAALLYGEIGSHNQARALLNLALLHSERGDIGAAIKINRQADEKLRETGQIDSVVQNLINLGDLLTQSGDFEESEQVHAEAFRFLETWDNPSSLALALRSWGELLLRQGKLTEARVKLIEARDMQEETGDRVDNARTTSFLAEVYALQGDLPQALRLQTESLEVFKENGIDARYAKWQTQMAETLLQQAKLTEAEESLNETLAVLNTLVDPLPAAKTRLALAELALTRQVPDEAIRLATKALTSISRIPTRPDQAHAHMILARSYFAQGNLDEAAEQSDQARGILGKITSPIYQTPLAIIDARILARKGEVEQALTKLQELLPETTNESLVGLSLEIELAQGEIDLANGSRESGLSRLAEVAESALRKGYILISQRARQASGESIP